jgi:hypothetical protein
MNRDSVLSVYSDARTEYTKQLCVFLVPAYFQFFVDLLDKSKQAMINEPKRSLWQFQTYLNEIHDWNMEKVKQEIQTIHTNCGCDYLEDLLTAVFIAHTKVLTAIRLSSNHKKIEINVPKVEHFLFKVLCESAKLLWSSTYLFRDGISGVEKQQNYRTIENILNEGILQAVRSMVPVKSILKDFVSGDAAVSGESTEDAKEDSDDEEEDKKEETASEAPMSIPEAPQHEHHVSEPSLPLEAPVVEESPTQPIDVPSEPSTLSSNAEVTHDTQIAPVIVIDEKPNVRFGQFDAIFHSEHPDASDMIYDPKDGMDETHEEHSNEFSPVLEIMEEEGSSLSAGVDFDSLDEPSESNQVEEDDYEELP